MNIGLIANQQISQPDGVSATVHVSERKRDATHHL